MSNYNAAVDGAIVELDYYWMKDEFRIVPKAAVEYVQFLDGRIQGARSRFLPGERKRCDRGAGEGDGRRGGRALLHL
jgi:hypothetical protein